MVFVNSVRGAIDTADLGFTLMHEHILVGWPGIYRDYPELLGSNLLETAVEELNRAKNSGIDTIVDMTTHDLGRNVAFVAEAAERTGMNIIACTGWWWDFPRFFLGVNADRLAEVFIREIQVGISGTDIKAGILKSASDIPGVTPDTEVILRAIGRAHLETGAPIALHSYAPGQVGRAQLAVLKEEGVDLTRVKVDHSNDTLDLDYLTWLLDQGCYLGMDRYPGWLVSAEARTKTLKALMDAGYEKRLCPSHDYPILYVISDHPERKKRDFRKRNPHGHLYIHKVVFPQLLEMGVSERAINELFVDNPRRFFEGN